MYTLQLQWAFYIFWLELRGIITYEFYLICNLFDSACIAQVEILAIIRRPGICSSSGPGSLFIQSLFISSLRMKAEIKLFIQPCFPHTTRLMVIIRIHLMISLAECTVCAYIALLTNVCSVMCVCKCRLSGMGTPGVWQHSCRYLIGPWNLYHVQLTLHPADVLTLTNVCSVLCDCK